MDRTQGFLERRRAHCRSAHHVGAGLDIRAIPRGARQIFLHEPHALERDAIGKRVVERPAIASRQCAKASMPVPTVIIRGMPIVSSGSQIVIFGIISG